MSDPATTTGPALTHALLQRRRQEVARRHERAVGKVGELLDTQRRLGGELGEGLRALSASRTELEGVERAASETGLLAALVRPFTLRRASSARRSIALSLIRQYEQVDVRLREATAFADELHLVALELQQEVDQLHRDLQDATRGLQRAAQRVIELEQALVELDSDAATPPEARDRLRDRYTFDLRSEGVSVTLHETAVALCREHLPGARSLRDTVLRLHEDMAKYVLTATHTVNAAGRRIQGLGMLADAPSVVSELQQSIDALDAAMQATAAHVEASQRWVATVLPDLSARLQAETEAANVALSAEVAGADRERAERALRLAAEVEVDETLLGRR